ncbi:pyruvate formate-lyase-activating protein [Paenibacillus sp. TRM 82003]|uniref:pyruvate formate-lyase-activating protein n=1 Tax=Kineococcus sp. TRM81007 TaxID=2925831 RepID=UPI001F5A5E69|nr:pyruvate formate-lyase-activating protein [Kineococcus sp. TRM81007]MCI2239358.1 pyruvate formate-lyase-activating protein [Kineococcus sp. TRM81007]MCI3925040.1 pyruvate formate-lyase-activating protein [Paenibacillus sp. TRM 82003]
MTSTPVDPGLPPAVRPERTVVQPLPGGTLDGVDIDAVEGRLHSWELVTALDGPGTRLVTWVTGCSLRCRHCHNPDTRDVRNGTPTTVGEHAGRLVRYRSFLRASGRGVTISGGEPLVQPAFTAAFLRRAKELDLHTALDTSGCLGARASDELLDDVDLVLLDVKSSDPATYRRVTARPLAPTLRFAERLAGRGDRMWIRFVLVPGLTDAQDDVDGVARIAASLGPAVERVEVLPHHSTGRSKYERLGLPYPLPDTPAPTVEQTERARDAFRDRGLTVL